MNPDPHHNFRLLQWRVIVLFLFGGLLFFWLRFWIEPDTFERQYPQQIVQSFSFLGITCATFRDTHDGYVTDKCFWSDDERAPTH